MHAGILAIVRMARNSTPNWGYAAVGVCLAGWFPPAAFVVRLASSCAVFLSAVLLAAFLGVGIAPLKGQHHEKRLLFFQTQQKRAGFAKRRSSAARQSGAQTRAGRLATQGMRDPDPTNGSRRRPGTSKAPSHPTRKPCAGPVGLLFHGETHRRFFTLPGSVRSVIRRRRSGANPRLAFVPMCPRREISSNRTKKMGKVEKRLPWHAASFGVIQV